MAFLDHEGGAEFQYPKEQLFEAVVKAIDGLKGMKVEKTDKVSGRIVAKAGISMMSWGENIPISLLEVSPGVTRISVTSTPKTGVLFGGAFDLGKNRKNIEKILDKTSEIISANPPIINTKNSENLNADHKICSKCGSSNLNSSNFCKKCGNKLKSKNNIITQKDSTTNEPTNPFDEIKKAKELLDLGAITEEEYESIKNKFMKLI